MAGFAQVNYNQKLGNGKYTVAQAGCFVTAFSNLLEGFGIITDPGALNDAFKSRGLYMRDADGANEDLSWGSITGYDNRFHVVRMGSGWPVSANSIVKFYYRAHNGQKVTHFCKLYSATEMLIVDSYDGQVKKSPYGDPIAYATYDFTGPHIIEAYKPPAPGADHSFHPWVGKVKAMSTVQVRAEPRSTSKGNLGNVNSDGLLHAGNEFDVVGWQHGEDPYRDGKDVWLKTGRGHWVWAYNTNFFSLPGHGAGESMVETNVFRNSPLVRKGYSPAPLEGESEELKIPVPVKPADPNKWLLTYRQFTDAKGNPMPLLFTAKGNHVISDLLNPALPEGMLRDGMLVEIAGDLEKDGVRYYRTTASEDAHTWYIIEQSFLSHDNALDQLAHETFVMSKKEKFLARAGTVRGFLDRLFKRGKN